MRSRYIILLAIIFTIGFTSFNADAQYNQTKIVIGQDLNNSLNPFIQPQDEALAGGGRDQSLQFADIVKGGIGADILIGGLGSDVLVGLSGDDIILGGTEDFNPANRDIALGGMGSDTFIWAPGDGSDFFDGGPGEDVVVFGFIGEVQDDGTVAFQVQTDQDTEEIFINPDTNLPEVDVANSPGFCTVIDKAWSEDAKENLELLELNQLVRFTIRALADSFESGEQDTDNGLRVTLSIRNTEYLVCTTRDGGEIEVLDLKSSPPRKADISDLPEKVQTMLNL